MKYKTHIKYSHYQRKEKIVLQPDGRVELIEIGEPILSASRCNCKIGKNHD